MFQILDSFSLDISRARRFNNSDKLIREGVKKGGISWSGWP